MIVFYSDFFKGQLQVWRVDSGDLGGKQIIPVK